MQIKTFPLILGFFMLALSLQAQKEETVLGHRGFGLTGIWGGSTHQLTQFGATNSFVRGGHFALEFGKSFLIGLSNYKLATDVKWDLVSNQPFDMRWRTLKTGYAFKSYRAVHPLISVDAGPGRVKLENTRDNIFVIQPAAGLEFNIFRWFHLGLEGGYRFVTDSNIASLSDDNLSGPFGQATLRFGWSWGRYRSKSSRD